jgi:hypothetical protein
MDFSRDQELRLKVCCKLVKQVYEPIPLAAADKMPYIRDWQLGEMTRERRGLVSPDWLLDS